MRPLPTRLNRTTMAGLFFCLDGVDGGGKSTQVRMLCDWLQARGQQTLSLRDPGATRLGEALREILLHRQDIPLTMTAEMLLYMASRAQLVQEVIRPALEMGTVVICDRFLLANVVYQGSAGGIDVDSIWQVGEVATGGLNPDMTFVLDLDVTTALGRIDRGFDRLESRGAEYMQKVREGFVQQSERLRDRVKIIDASQPIEVVHASIVAQLARFEL